MSKTTIDIDVDLQDLIPNFIENRKKDLEALQSLVAQNKLTEIAQLAHKIKGAAAGYGFAQLSDFASQMEIAAKNNNSAPLRPLLEQMKTHFSNIDIHYISM